MDNNATPSADSGTTSTGPTLRRSKRQLELRDRHGCSAGKISKYPEGEWISTTPTGNRDGVKEKTRTSEETKSPKKKRGVKRKTSVESSGDTDLGTKTPENVAEAEAEAETKTVSESGVELDQADGIAKSPLPGEESSEDDDLPLAQIVLKKKVEEMLDVDSIPLVQPLAETEAPKPSEDASAAPEEPAQDATLFCADSDAESSNDDAMGELVEKPTIPNSREQQAGEDDTQYPCTVCRQSSLASRLTRCQNCPRYFHHECIQKSGSDAQQQDPARRRFCPKCERYGPAVSSSLLLPKMMKKKKQQQQSKRREKPAPVEPSRFVVKYRRVSNSGGVYDVGDLATTCPGCGLKSAEVKRKREKGEDYSIYCNEACITRTLKKTYRALKGQDDERVLIMDTVIGNVVERRNSPFLRNLSTWLMKHLTCYPVLPEKRHEKKPVASKEISTTFRSRESGDGGGGGESGVSSSHGRIGSTPPVEDDHKIGGDQPSAVDPYRLNVRKALRDVFLLRAKDANDVLLTGDEIKQFAVDLELEVNRVHRDEHSYKQQCRNLIANLRNPSNKGLFRRLLNGELTTKRAATLTATEMNSTEYSYWAAAVEQERAEETERLKMAYMETSKLFGKAKVVSEADSTCDIFGLLHNDTTNEHKSHLFDLNCKICTGKQKEEEAPAPLAARRERKDTATSSRSSVSLSYRPELGEKLIKRDDGKMDIVYSVPISRKSDPLHLETHDTTSAVGTEMVDVAATSPVVAASRVSHSKSSRHSSDDRESHRSSRTLTIEDTGPAMVTPRPSELSVVTSRTPDKAHSSTISPFRPMPPTSTVPSFWHGLLDMPQWFRFQTSFKLVSGPVHLLKRDLPSKLDIVGRIHPSVVYDYLSQIKKNGLKDVIIFRLPEPPLDEDRQQWTGLFSNMVDRQRFCVVENKTLHMIKDFYILPLSADEDPNDSLLPFHDGPGLEIPRKNTVLGLVVRHRERQGAEVSKKASVDRPSPMGLNSPHSESRKDSSTGDMDYMKIIQFHSTSTTTTATTTAGEEKDAVEMEKTEQVETSGPAAASTPVAQMVATAATATAPSPVSTSPVQPQLKQLLDEIGQAQNPTDLANKILNCLNQTAALTSVSSPTLSSVASGSTRADTTSTPVGRPADPRQRATPVAAVTGKKDGESGGKKEMGGEDDTAEEDNMKEWMSQMQSMMMKTCLPQQGNTPEGQSGASGNQPDSPQKNSADTGRQSGWQPMVAQVRPPSTSPARPSMPPPPTFNIPPPYLPRPPPHLPRPPPPPFTSAGAAAGCPPMQVPPFPPPSSQPGYFPTLAPPPVPPPIHAFANPPPYLLAPPPPPPPPASASILERSREEGEVRSSEEEGDDDQTRRSSRKWHKRSEWNEKGRRSWERPEHSEKSYWRSSSSSMSRHEDRGESSAAGYSRDIADDATSSSGNSGVILKQAFYGKRRPPPRSSGSGRFTRGDPHQRRM